MQQDRGTGHQQGPWANHQAMKQVEKFIPPAVQLIKDHLATGEGKLVVPSVYKGYISSMGASIIMSGLLPTLAFYNTDGDNSSSEKARRPLLNVLHGLLKDRHEGLDRHGLFEHAIGLQEAKRHAALRQLKEEVIQASIAVKLALRTFKMEGFSPEPKEEETGR